MRSRPGEDREQPERRDGKPHPNAERGVARTGIHQATGPRVAANRVLQLRLKAAATALSAGDTSDVGCGGLAYVSQSLQRQLTTTLSVAVTQLRTLGLIFGRTLPDLGPEPTDSRPANGDVVIRTGAGGNGALRVKNGSATDVAVSIVTPGKPPSKPHIMLYVQSKKTATVYRIGGCYNLYVKSGKDWNPKRRQFSSDCSFKSFDQSFSRNTGLGDPAEAVDPGQRDLKPRRPVLTSTLRLTGSRNLQGCRSAPCAASGAASRPVR